MSDDINDNHSSIHLNALLNDIVEKDSYVYKSFYLSSDVVAELIEISKSKKISASKLVNTILRSILFEKK